MKYLLLLPALLVVKCMYCQGSAPIATEMKLVDHQLYWSAPVEEYKVPYKPVRLYQAYDFGVLIRKEKLEVRYLVVSLLEDKEENTIPHLKAPAMAIHLADNDEDAMLTSHQLDPAVIDSVYQADWAQTFFFQPKAAFSSREHCQMTAFFREGVALVYVFMLFDAPPASLPAWSESMRFRPLPAENEEQEF